MGDIGSNSNPGMGAERRGKYLEQCQREVFLNGLVDVTKDKHFKKLVPRPFKDGVWVDEKCLETFQV